RFAVDDSNQGGSTLTVGGKLTNSNQFLIGNGGLNANTTVTVSGLSNTGTLSLSGTPSNRAALIDSGAAPAIWTGLLDLSGKALLQFGSGSITEIGGGAHINENGSNAFVATAPDQSSNSGLSGVAKIDQNAQLFFANGASLT